MLITKPTLPPRQGYVERVDADGKHYYAPTPETEARIKTENEVRLSREVDAALLYHAEDETQAAEQFRRAVQFFAASLNDDKAMEIATIYDPWKVGKAYALGDFLTYGTNSVGDPQLYKVVQEHTSMAAWTPDTAPSLYDAIGLDDSGYPVWSQPTGAHDAYNTGDIVNYNGTLYRSLMDGNTYSPEAYPGGWEVYEQ